MALIPALLALLQEGEGHAADTAAAAGEHASAGPFTINGGLILWTLLIFGILLLILAKTAWPAILKQIEEREHRIQADLDAAARANADAQALLAQYREQLDSAREQAGEMVAEARTAGDKLREEMVAKGRVEHEALLERARREIGLEKERAVADLRREAVELSLAAASKVIERNVGTEADRKLVTDFLARIPTHKS